MTTFFEAEGELRLGLPQQGLRTVLSIAGLDPSGGAGLLADARTFVALGTWPLAVATTVTFQSTIGLGGRFDLPREVIVRELKELFADRKPNALKTGALGGGETAGAIAEFIEAEFEGPVVVDPVLAAGSGGALLGEEGVRALVEQLLPRATLVTPNAKEAALLTGFEVSDIKDAEAAALRLIAMGARSALVTGVKTDSDGSTRAADVFCDGEDLVVYTSAWRDGLDVHGTGCVLSAAIAACLAKGMSLQKAVGTGRLVTLGAIEGAIATGRGAPNAMPEAGRGAALETDRPMTVEDGGEITGTGRVR